MERNGKQQREDQPGGAQAGAEQPQGEPKTEEKKKDDGVIDAEVVDEKK